MRSLMSLAQAATWLGLQPRTLYNQRYRGELPGCLGIKVNGVVRYRPEDLESYIDHQAARETRNLSASRFADA